jgi:hypothetical protein
MQAPQPQTLMGELNGMHADPEMVALARRHRGPLGVKHVIGAAGEPAFQNGWASYQEPSYLKQSDGFVRLFGAVLNPAAPGGVNTIFVLPSNFRPARAHVFPSFYSFFAQDSFGNHISPYLEPYIEVFTDGRVVAQAAGNIPFLPLDGKVFQAA